MKIRMALLEKGLPFGRRFVNSWAFDHYQPGYQALNPLSLVPTLVDDDGTAVIQSNVILEYLEQKYPESAIIPDDPILATQAREWMVAEQDYLFPAIVTMSFNTMMKIRVEVFGIERLAEWSRAFLDQEKAQDYLRRMSAPADWKAEAAAAKKFDFHMKRLQKQLNKHQGPWICGEQFTIADISLAGIMDRIEFLDRADSYEKYPEIDAWFKQLKQRESYKKGLHKFEDRMWGPLKNPDSYPYKDDPKYQWGYWKDSLLKIPEIG